MHTVNHFYILLMHVTENIAHEQLCDGKSGGERVGVSVCA